MNNKVFKILPLFVVFVMLFSSVSFAATSSSLYSDFSQSLPVNISDMYSNSAFSNEFDFYTLKSNAEQSLVDVYGAIDISQHNVAAFVSSSLTSIYFVYFYEENLEFTPQVHDTYIHIKGTISPWYSSISNNVYTGSYYMVWCYFDSSNNLVCKTSSDNSSFLLPIRFGYSSNIFVFKPTNSFNDVSLDMYPIYHKGNVYIDTVGTYLFASDGEESGSDIVLPDDGEITDPNISGLLDGIIKYFNSFLDKIKGFFNSVVSAITSFENSLRSLLETFINSLAGWISGLHSSVMDIYDYITDTSFDASILNDSQFISSIQTVVSYADYFKFSDIQAAEEFYLTLDFTSASAPLNSVGIIYIDFAWYVPYRNTVATFLLIFLYVGLAWRVIHEVPGIVSGLSGSSPK